MAEGDWLIDHVSIATMQRGDGEPYGAIIDGLLAVSGGKIEWVGPRIGSPRFSRRERINGHGAWLTPGLIDCHTHLIYAGSRVREFELRQQGRSYAEIAGEGGGILHTVRETNAATDGELVSASLDRLRRLLAEGVTTVEIKSGYGLDLHGEMRLLQVADALRASLPITIAPTYLAAHAVPLEFANDRDAYIDHICSHVMPAIAESGLATAVDLFCDEIAFTVTQCRRILETARALGFAVKGHVEQLSHTGGAALLAEFEALSADHLEYLADEDVQLLKTRHVVAVLLPGAYYFAGNGRMPPVDKMRAAGVRIAVATDCNPGSAPIASLLTTMNLACVLFGLTPEESFRGVTVNAARALGMQCRKGTLRPGFDADVLLWEIDHPAALSATINMYRPRRVWVGGRDVSPA